MTASAIFRTARLPDEPEALGLAAPGPFQLEAAIQAAHCHRAFTGATPWREIAVLYQRLLDTAPTIGARIGHAMAVAHAHDDPLAGLRLLDAIEVPGVAAHQPWWATRAHLLARTDAVSEAIDAYDHGAGTAPPSCGSQGEGPRPSELIASGPTPSLHFATAPPVRGRSIGRSTSLPV